MHMCIALALRLTLSIGSDGCGLRVMSFINVFRLQ